MDYSAAQAFFVAGTMQFILLDFAHLVYTRIERSRPFRLTPRNPEVHTAMMQTELKIYPGANLWRVWLGFNCSHSLGVIIFNVFCLGTGHARLRVDRHRHGVCEFCGGGFTHRLNVTPSSSHPHPLFRRIAGEAVELVEHAVEPVIKRVVIGQQLHR
jgi:hypothetical protein